MKNDAYILTMRTDVTNKNNVVSRVSQLINERLSAYICVSNVHMCMETFDSEIFMNVVNNADMVIPDGRPIYWAQRLLGFHKAEQVRGQDIMHELCLTSQYTKFNIGLYGASSDKILATVANKLKQTFPGINITYMYSPPFRPLTSAEDEIVIDEINKRNVNILFVGIGCPKQEIWMSSHKGRLNCVMVGVGAAFDFISGSKKHAPRWMQKFGLEWLFRLFSEPKRLWKRYLKQNPRFIFHMIKQLLCYQFKKLRRIR